MDEILVVQYFPCGHVANMRRSELIELNGTRQLDLIEAGKKLDAPILHSEHCTECKEHERSQDLLALEMDLDVVS